MRTGFGFSGFGFGTSSGTNLGSFDPFMLGASLLGYWDAESVSTLTLAGSLVTTWADRVAGYAPTQATSGFKPVYSATSFNGRPGVTFDGTDDYLELASVPFPTGATACEIWGLADQTILGAVALGGGLFAYGGNASLNRRMLFRTTSGGVNRVASSVGNGGAGITTTEPTVDYSGIHVGRVVVSPTQTSVSADGSAPTTAAIVPATGTTRTRIGSNTSDVVATFWKGAINTIIVTNLLTAPQAAQLTAYLKTRGGIA